MPINDDGTGQRRRNRILDPGNVGTKTAVNPQMKDREISEECGENADLRSLEAGDVIDIFGKPSEILNKFSHG